MKTSANGRKFIEQWEGKFLKTYKDSVGVLTIGYGHTSAAGLPAVKNGMTITEAQADEILARDLGRVEADVNKLVKVPLTQNQFDVLVSFHFNTGALGRSTLLKLLNGGNYAAVPHELMLYVNGKGKFIQGLANRRKAESNLWTKKDSPIITPKETGTVAAGGLLATAMAYAHQHWMLIAGVAVASIAGYIVYKVIKRRRNV